MRTILPIAAVSLLLAAAPAAEAKQYAGKTRGGHEVSFNLHGGKVTKLRALVPTSCVATGGSSPRAGGELYEPPSAIRVGGERRAQALQEPAMHYDKVTKHYRTTIHKRGKRVVGKLHVNFSFNTIRVDLWGTHLEGWVCQGDDRFSVR